MIQPQDVVLWTGLILTLLNILDRVSILREKSKAPYKELEQRITVMESQVSKMATYLDNDNKRIIHLEEGGRVILKSLGALLSHGIDGNNINEMKVAREELNDYLIGR